MEAVPVLAGFTEVTPDERIEAPCAVLRGGRPGIPCEHPHAHG